MRGEEHFAEIPPCFYSFQEEGLFKRCIECDRNLLEEKCEYVIEKAIRNYPDFNTSDVIFDYAICMDCARKIHNKLSKESIENIRNFFNQKLDVNERSRKIAEAKGNVDELISDCMISHREAKISSEYQIFAHCVGDKINLQNPPYMLSSEVLEELSEILSVKTREELDGFFNRHFSPDPSLMESTPKFVFV